MYAKQAFGSPESVVEYLGRYTHRVAISNARILKVTDTHVTFSWCDREKRLPKENRNHSRRGIPETFSRPHCAALFPEDTPPGVFGAAQQKAKPGSYPGKSWGRAGTGPTTFAGAGAGITLWRTLAAEMSRLRGRTAIIGNLAQRPGAPGKCKSRNRLTPDILNFKLMRCLRRRNQKRYACWCKLLIKTEHGNEKQYQNGRIYFEICLANWRISRRKPENQAVDKIQKTDLKHYKQSINYQLVKTR